jgi:ATP-dependent DNA helicase RecQ
MTTKAVEVFKKEFPSLANNFALKPFQEKVINQVITDVSTLAVMPTGGGKSLIYWVSAKALKGTCLVISPLIALIDEQAEKLANEGLNVLAIHGGMGASEQMILTSFLPVLKEWQQMVFSSIAYHYRKTKLN